jgi:hypothetical protein
MIPIHGADIVGIESQANDLLYAPRYLWLSDVNGQGVQEIYRIGSQAMEPKKQWWMFPRSP